MIKRSGNNNPRNDSETKNTLNNKVALLVKGKNKSAIDAGMNFLITTNRTTMAAKDNTVLKTYCIVYCNREAFLLSELFVLKTIINLFRSFR